jgi:hypothetical protein
MAGSYINQKRLFDRKEITIMEDHLVVRSKSVKEELRYKVNFEDLGFETMFRKTRPSGLIFGLVLLLDAGALTGLWNAFSGVGDAQDRSVAVISFLILAAVTVFMIWHRRKSFIYLTGGNKTVGLFANIPNSLIVENFINEIHQAMRDHIRSKYLPFRETMSVEDKLELLEWLKKEKIIHEKEYEDLLMDINLERLISDQQDEDYQDLM